MLRNYLKIALRNLWKNRAYTTINIFGLMIAFCVGSFLVLTAYFQLTFDNFHQNSNKIFQSYFLTNEEGVVNSSGATPLPLAPAIKGASPKFRGNSPYYWTSSGFGGHLEQKISSNRFINL